MQGIRSSALAVVLACSAATTNAAHLTKDPLTQLPLPTITDNAFGNDPTEMPGRHDLQEPVPWEFLFAQRRVTG
jgi:hypothetical protein